mgnify:CR=1 FL=1
MRYKYLGLILYIILLFWVFGCKKDITPTQPAPSNKRFLYRWDYMINGSNQIYEGKGCYYPTEMDSVQSSTGAFNVKIISTC